MCVSNKLFIGTHPIQSAIRIFLQDEGGAIVEFAIAVPILISIIFATLHLGFIMFIWIILEVGVREAARYGVTGQTMSGQTQADSIKSVLNSTLTTYSGGLINTNLVTITVKAYSNLQAIGTPEPFTDVGGKGYYVKGYPYTDVNGNGVWDSDQGIVGSFGLRGQAVLYQVSYVWDTLFPIFGSSSKVTISAKTPVVNENF